MHLRSKDVCGTSESSTSNRREHRTVISRSMVAKLETKAPDGDQRQSRVRGLCAIPSFLYVLPWSEALTHMKLQGVQFTLRCQAVFSLNAASHTITFSMIRILIFLPPANKQTSVGGNAAGPWCNLGLSGCLMQFQTFIEMRLIRIRRIF